MGKPFQPAEWKARPLTVVLYWRPRRGPQALQNGHAALILNTQEFEFQSVDWYASWAGTAGRNLVVNAANQNTFFEDAQQWGGEQVGANNEGTAVHVPNKWVALSSLNIGEMKTAWDGMRRVGAHWKLIDKNCATAVARILKAGGGDNLAKSSRNQMVWWPTDLIRYATSMKGGIVATSGDA